MNENLENTLHLADCIDLLRDWHSKGQTNFIDLIYIDPPFNSNRNYNVLFDSKLTEEAFLDTWSSVSYLDELEGMATMSPNLYNFLKMLETTGLPKSYISYLTKMSIRCWYMREMLKDTGSLYFHCDPTMSHYVKIILDYVFGMGNFKNEIIWCYKSGGKSKTIFPKKHDVLLYYGKTKNTNFYPDRVRIERINPNNKIIEENGEKFVVFKKFNREYKYKYSDGAMVEDWWDDITNIGPNNKTERIGYPTQKPEKLLERIILASSNEGDLVADFFMGGGTTISVANKLNRKFIGSDINMRALQITQRRLEELQNTVKKDFTIFAIPNSAEDLRKMVDANVIGSGKNSKFELEEITVKYYLKNQHVVGNKVKVGDGSIDGYFVFPYRGKQETGLVQITSGAGIGHLKAFCSEVGKGTGKIGVYISFADRMSPGMIREAKSYGKVGTVDKIQMLTFEQLINNNQSFDVPKDILTI